jgi:SpoVK/Ycf46/Vps4 family AAA+-type ATPase
VVATANVIEDLPPELIRKGRFDEIFFVDLPDADIRREIFSIHLQKRKCNVESIDLHKLAEQSDGFSGAEIEQVIITGLYRSHSEQKPLDMAMLETAISSTQPLSVVMAEQIDALRTWAEGRTVTA